MCFVSRVWNGFCSASVCPCDGLRRTDRTLMEERLLWRESEALIQWPASLCVCACVRACVCVRIYVRVRVCVCVCGDMATTEVTYGVETVLKPMHPPSCNGQAAVTSCWTTMDHVMFVYVCRTFVRWLLYLYAGYCIELTLDF